MKTSKIMALCALALSLSIPPALAQGNVTLENAIQTVYSQNYSQPGLEYLDSTPKREVTTDSTPFWVVEIISAGNIAVMVPVNAKTGRVDTSDYMKDVLKTHYLANFLEKTKSLSQFLTDTRSFADTTQGSLDSKDSEYRNVLKPQLNRTFSTEAAYLGALAGAKQKAAALGTSIGDTQALITDVRKPSDIFALQSSFTGAFAKERDFLDGLEAAMDASDALKGEILASGLASENPSLYQALLNSISISGREKLPGMRTDLEGNEREISSFFSDLDNKGNDFLLKLRQRSSQTLTEQQRKAVESSLTAYKANYTYISSNQDKVASVAKVDELRKMIDQSEKAYLAGDYAAARANFSKIDSAIRSLMDEIRNYVPPVVKPPQQQGMNWTLVLALAAVLVALVLYKFKDRIFKGGEGKIERKESTPYWGYRS